MQNVTNNYALRLKLLCFAISISANLISCGSSNDSKGTSSDANFQSLWTNTFEPRCGTCHGVSSNIDTVGGPDMRTQDAFHSGLVSKKGSDYPNWETFQNLRADCLNYAFVSPGNPSQSLLVAIFDSSVTPCTVKNHGEPPQSTSITSDQLTLLKTWITNGAAR